MTEKEQHSTSQHEDEISLVSLLGILIKKKVLILAVTCICTLLSIMYAQSITPTYESSISFTKPQETFLALLPADITKHLPGGVQIDKDTGKPNFKLSAFSLFLSKITSFNFQKKVFKDGEFLKKFYDKSSTPDIENAVVGIHSSIRVSKEKVDIELPDYERPVSISMTGHKPKVMSEYLNALAQSSRQAVDREIKDLISLLSHNQVVKISQEIDILRSVAKELAIKDKATFSEALRTARSLGIKNNNFDKLKGSNVDIGVSSQARTNLGLRSAAEEGFLESREKTIIKIQDTTLPTWYLYGEKALQQELDTIKSRKNDMPIPGVSLKSISLKKYNDIAPSSLKIHVVTISQPSIPPSSPIKPKKIVIIVIGVTLGLVFGFFMAFIRNSMDQLSK